MAGAPRISLTERGGTQFRARINEMSERVGDLTLAGAVVIKGLEEYHERTWGRGVEDTAATDDRWPGHGPLYNTGALKKSMTSSGAAGAIRDIGPGFIRFGTKIPYAGYLQRGTKKMARKPVLRKDRALRAVLGKIMRDFIVHGRRDY